MQMRRLFIPRAGLIIGDGLERKGQQEMWYGVPAGDVNYREASALSRKLINCECYVHMR
jgi:hypothetical protein